MSASSPIWAPRRRQRSGTRPGKAMRVFLLRIVAAKNSMKRRARASAGRHGVRATQRRCLGRQGNAGQDRSQRRAWHRPADAARLVPSGALQTFTGAGSTSTIDSAQAAADHDVENSLRGVLRGFGLKVGPTTPRTFVGRIRELVAGHGTLSTVAEALLAARFSSNG
jgi:hypothetical protein